MSAMLRLRFDNQDAALSIARRCGGQIRQCACLDGCEPRRSHVGSPTRKFLRIDLSIACGGGSVASRVFGFVNSASGNPGKTLLGGGGPTRIVDPRGGFEATVGSFADHVD